MVWERRGLCIYLPGLLRLARERTPAVHTVGLIFLHGRLCAPAQTKIQGVANVKGGAGSEAGRAEALPKAPGCKFRGTSSGKGQRLPERRWD